MMANAIASATANSGCRRLKCNPLAVLIARHLAPGDFFGGITWNFSFGFLRLVGSIQQKPVALSHRWLLSRHLRALVGGVLGRSAWSRRHRQFLAPADPARPAAAASALE